MKEKNQGEKTGNVKEMKFPKIMIYTSNKIPNDPEASFSSSQK